MTLAFVDSPQMVGGFALIMAVGMGIGFALPGNGKALAGIVFAAPFLAAVPFLASAEGGVTGVLGQWTSGVGALTAVLGALIACGVGYVLALIGSKFRRAD